MGMNKRLAGIALLVIAASCGSGGGGSSGSGGAAGSAFGVVQLLGHSPADDEVQVDLEATIVLEFDAEMALETFADIDTWLRVAGTEEDIACTFTRGASGRVACQPNAPLLAETDYVFQLSALTGDLSGRILDVTTRFTFRTFDETPPTLQGLDVADGATGVNRTRSFTLTFDEAIAPSSVGPATLYVRDIFNGRFPADYAFDGGTVVVTPRADLPGNRQFFVIASTTLTDRAGNRLLTSFQSSFTTAADAVAPTVTSAWPALNAAGVSPFVQPTFTFSESMDPATVEAASLLFQDQFGSLIPFAIDASPDQRSLRVRPTVRLQDDRKYTLAFLLGGAAATDVSGNPLAATQALTFTTGTDDEAPKVISSSPAANELRVPGILVADVVYDEDLDPAFVNTDTVRILVDGAEWTSVVQLVNDNTVRVTPVLDLPTDTTCTLVIDGGQAGIHDVAGNVQAGDTTIQFTTSNDAELPQALLLPPNGAVDIARGSKVCVAFDAPMDPATLNAATIRVTDDFDVPIAGALEVHGDNRFVTFTPATPFVGNTYYRLKVVGGNAGARRLSGNWFDSDRTSRFRTGQTFDSQPPTISATVNGVPQERRAGLVLPPTGFTIDCTLYDTGNQWVDMSSVEVLLTGGVGPAPATLLAASEVDFGTFVVQVPENAPLAAGQWSMTVRVRDLSGNQAQSNTVAFEVDNRTSVAMPFERTQVVWVRTDLDRNANGTADFTDDMLRLGFATAGDPAGTNAYMERLLRTGILAKANQLYKRGTLGEPLDSDSVQLRFTTREPIALQHMQIALGGFDPEGPAGRGFGDESSGVLGRAFYDYRNGNISERNVAMSPGLGVFPAEMWLYQARIHNQVYPGYQTTFAQKFLPICPDMGGTPAGSSPLDAVVLRADFDYDAANPSQRARWNTIMAAADDWSSVIGVILAHEVGHSVGLVAPGAMPNGLFGDSSLHDTYASAAEVMAPSVGYEAMISLDYKFRDIDLAYLQQRVLLR